MRFASEGMALGMMACRHLAMERPARSWPEQALPYGLSSWVTPSGWTLTETSCDVRLPTRPGMHPAAPGG